MKPPPRTADIAAPAAKAAIGIDIVAGGMSRRAIRNCAKAIANTMSDNCMPGNGMTGQICNGSRMMPMTISEVVCRSEIVTFANAK